MRWATRAGTAITSWPRKGNCGGAEMEDVLGEYYRINLGVDNLDFHGSPDEERWNAWHNLQPAEDKLKEAS